VGRARAPRPQQPLLRAVPRPQPRPFCRAVTVFVTTYCVVTNRVVMCRDFPCRRTFEVELPVGTVANKKITVRHVGIKYSTTQNLPPDTCVTLRAVCCSTVCDGAAPRVPRLASPQYTNPYAYYKTFTLRSNQPWLMHFTPPRLQMPAGATRPVGLTFDARAATPGILDVLMFVNDEDDKTEECLKVRVRIYK
jgi:hypothetical protein